MADGTQPSPAAPLLTLPKLVALLVLTVAATGAVVYFAVRSNSAANEHVVTVLDARAAADAAVNTGEVLDATGPNQLEPELGRRYRVRIDGESRDGASMTTRIGKTIVFVRDVRAGDVVEVEITRLNKTTAEAIVLARISSGPVPEARAAAPASAPTGEIYTGTVVRVGKFGDGLIKRGAQQVYVPGVEQGERVVYEVIEKRDRYWNGRLIRKLAAEEAAPRAAPAPAEKLRAPQVQPGQEFDVVVKEKARGNPETDGVARIDGLAVLIPGCQPGDRLKIRITERRPTLAQAEIVARLQPDAK